MVSDRHGDRTTAARKMTWINYSIWTFRMSLCRHPFILESDTRQKTSFVYVPSSSISKTPPCVHSHTLHMECTEGTCASLRVPTTQRGPLVLTPYRPALLLQSSRDPMEPSAVEMFCWNLIAKSVKSADQIWTSRQHP